MDLLVSLLDSPATVVGCRVHGVLKHHAYVH
jgi:hypothetical protein